jgi:hypothetical protein
VSLESTVSLLVASLDLKLVQLVRGAMAVADVNGRATAPPGCNGAGGRDAFLPRRHIEPAPVYEPRRHIHPEPRPLLQPATRLANETCDCAAYVAPAGSKSPIEPPWKVLPWENPPQPPPKIKFVLQRPDSARSKGVFVNVFA